MLPHPSNSPRQPHAVIALSLLAVVAGCARPGPPREPVAMDAREVLPGLIDFELRGVSEEHRALARSLGEILDDEAIEENPLEEFLPRSLDDSLDDQFFELGTQDTARALAALRARADLVYAEPEVRVEALFTPDDELYVKQWHLAVSGAPAAWEAARGAGVTVAVLDTGVARLDDFDRARILDGFNFLTHSGAPGAADDDHFHGTHVAGTIAESTNNGRGGAGMAPLAKVLPLKVLSALGSGSSAGISEAIRYAADHGAQVINLSLGGGASSEAMARAVAYARRKGALVVAAAGNTGERGVSFPAAYPEALAVSAVGPAGTLAPYSAFGPEVALAAPGGDKSLGEENGVLQQTLDDSRQPAYRYLQGTSMAAPHVAGAAALVASLGVSDPGAIERVLLDSAASPPADGRAGPRAERYGAGLLDAGAAVRRVTLNWGLARLLLALAGALLALGHARRLLQVRRREALPVAFWGALLVASGGLALAATLGFARVPGLALLALAPAAMPLRFLGMPGSSLAATLTGWLAFSAAAPLLFAGIARAMAAAHERPAARSLGALASGLAFGQAGMLAQTAWVASAHLPGMPPWAVSIWLGLQAATCWFLGRALLAPAGG